MPMPIQPVVLYKPTKPLVNASLTVRKTGPTIVKVRKPVMTIANIGVNVKSNAPLICLWKNFSKVAKI